LTQQLFFEKLAQLNTVPKQELITRLSQIIGVNADGIYRRMRDKTPLTLDEAHKIAKEFKINFPLLDNSHLHEESSQRNETSHNFLIQIKELIQSFKNGGELTFYFDAKELPIFYLLQEPILYRFKQSFWQGMFFDNKTPIYEIDGKDDALFKEISDLFESIDTVELWGEGVLTSTLRQISYAVELDLIDASLVSRLLAHLKSLLQRLEEYCMKGEKDGGGKLEVFYNNVLVGDNSSMVVQANSMTSFISQNILDIYPIHDEAFNKKKLRLFQNTLRKSTPISVASEKERKKFFKAILEEINTMI